MRFFGRFNLILHTLRSAGARGLDASHSIDMSLRWGERNSINMSPCWGCASSLFEVNGTRSVPITMLVFTVCVQPNVRYIMYRLGNLYLRIERWGFGVSIHIALRPDKSGFKTGARGLDASCSIDISLRWSERNSINMSPRWGCASSLFQVNGTRSVPITMLVFTVCVQPNLRYIMYRLGNLYLRG